MAIATLHPQSRFVGWFLGWPLRWRYAAGTFLLGVVYTLVALLLGIRATLGGVDLTFWVGGVVEVSFGVFGYLLGLNAEARRRERRAADLIEDQLRQLARSRARLAQSEKLASLGELAGTVVHEVRNPLAIIRSMVQNLEEALRDAGDGPADGLEICRQVRDEVDRLARVTASLSAFSRRPALRLRPLDVAALARRVQALTQDLLDRDGLRLRLDQPEGAAGSPAGPALDPGPVWGDEDLLAQVLLGLVENAAAVSRGGGEVRLGWRLGEAGLELWVSDDGPGVAPELRERVFDPFFTTRADGHGLGLAVARQIAHAHGGEIAVDEAGAGMETCGATFRVRLPLDATSAGASLDTPTGATEEAA